jgi:hypothetical protein
MTSSIEHLCNFESGARACGCDKFHAPGKDHHGESPEGVLADLRPFTPASDFLVALLNPT